MAGDDNGLFGGLGKMIGNVMDDVKAAQEGGLMGLGKKLASNFTGNPDGNDDSSSQDDDSDDDSDDDDSSSSSGGTTQVASADHDDDDDIDGDTDVEDA